MTVRAIAFIVTALVVAACQGEQEGMELLCAAPERAGLEAHDPAQVGMVLAEWAGKNVSNSAATRVFERTTQVRMEERGPILRDASQELGLSDCHLADFWDGLAQDIEYEK
jgi:hypothetical protein